jgi:hypothetical protein
MFHHRYLDACAPPAPGDPTPLLLMPAQARLNLGSGPDCFTVELFTMKCKINGMAPVFAEIHGSPSTGIEEGYVNGSS